MQNEQPQVPTTASYWPGTERDTEDAAYKRSGLKKDDLLKRYNSRCKASKKWREDEYDKTWKRLIDLYRGKHFEGNSKHDRVAVNVSFSTVNVIVPSVAVNYPEISVNPRSPEKQQAAQTGEAAVNYWWRRWDWQDEVKRAVKDSLIIGHGWVKLGWRYRAKQRNLSPEEMQEAYNSAIAELDDYASQNPDLVDELPSDSQVQQLLPGTTDEVEDDRPYVERVSPFDIYIDPEATCPQDMKWIAQRLVVPLERVRADSRYRRTARRKLKATMATDPRWRDHQDPDKNDNQKVSDDIKRVTLFEYWDIEHQFYCVFAEGSDDYLLEPTDFPYPFGIPFVPIRNYEVPDQFYGIGDLEMLEPMQHELNAVRSDMANHRKRWQRAYLALRDKLDPQAQATLASPEDNRIVYVDGDEDLSRVVFPIQQIPLDPQMYNYSDQIESDIEIVSGITEYQRGTAPEVRRTATEASLIQDATNARVSDKLAGIEHFMAEIAERVLQLAQVYLTGEHVARIAQADGQNDWIQFDRRDIEGEFDFTVEAGSTQPKNEQFRRQNALNLAQALSPYVGVAVDPAALVTYILKDGFGVKNVQDFLVQAPPDQGPDEKLIQNVNYKDAPPDIQRQIEAAAGYQPSQIGGSSEIEKAQAKADEGEANRKKDMVQKDDQRQHEMTVQAMQQQAQMEQQALAQMHEQTRKTGDDVE